MDQANCRGLSVEEANLFYTPDDSDKPEGTSDKEWTSLHHTLRVERELTAKIRYCQGCPVRAACAELGWHEEHGIFGGLTATERRRIDKGERVGASGRHALPASSTRNRVVSLVRKGVPIPDVADHLGMKQEHVQTYLRQHLLLTGS